MPAPPPSSSNPRRPAARRAGDLAVGSALRRWVAWLLPALALAATVAVATPRPQGTNPGEPPKFTLPEPGPAPAPTLQQDEAWRASQAAIGRQLGEHALLDREGRPVRLSSLQGKPLIVSFVYTGCFQVCPTTTRSLREALQPLVEAFGEDNFNVVSIGFNQPADSPAAMRAFSAQHGLKAPNWDFLSPPPVAVDALLRDFGFSYVATPSGFDHIVGVTVVDASGRIHAQVYGERPRADELGEPLRQLLRGGPMPQRSGLAEVAERVRIICTVYDPETGRYRFAWGLVLEIAGGVTFALTMLVFFGLEWRDRRRARRAAAPQAPPTIAASPRQLS
jgi:protein SCO1/2